MLSKSKEPFVSGTDGRCTPWYCSLRNWELYRQVRFGLMAISTVRYGKAAHFSIFFIENTLQNAVLRLSDSGVEPVPENRVLPRLGRWYRPAEWRCTSDSTHAGQHDDWDMQVQYRFCTSKLQGISSKLVRAYACPHILWWSIISKQ